MTIDPQPQYSLLDSGDEMKLEQYGDFVVARPDPQAIWSKKLSEKEWDKAHAAYVKPSSKSSSRSTDYEKSSQSAKFTKSAPPEEERGKWVIKSGIKIPKNQNDYTEYAWPISLGPIKLYARLTAFKHTGIFPEQLTNWLWIEKQIKDATNGGHKIAQNTKTVQKNTSSKPKVLNLFGYTGGASIVAAQAGAEVTHVDASRSAITWARENMLLTGLDEKAIRWMLEDAVVFAKKELRRGNKYDAIIMDPPIFGRGAKGEVWKIEEDLKPLLEVCFELLSTEPLFFILNGYSAGYSSVAYANILEDLNTKFGGEIEHGELLIKERAVGSGSGVKVESLKYEADTINSSNKAQERLLPSGIVARWKRA